MSDENNHDLDVFEPPTGGEAGEAEKSALVQLPSTELLSEKGANECLKQRPARVISIIGERKCGKTTLISAIYERFIRGRFSSYSFAGSRTLSGFERKSFESRAESGRSAPETIRTSSADGLAFFHLGVASAGVRTDLLLSERAGEVYREARDNPSLSEKLVEVTNASTLIFVVDGERAHQPRMRAEAFASVRGTLRAFSDAGVIQPHRQIQIVTTKCDIFSGDQQADQETRMAIDQFEKSMHGMFKEKFDSLTTWRVSARDPTGKIEPAWGVENLFSSWITFEPRFEPFEPKIPELIGEFDRLLLTRYQEGKVS